MSRTSHQNGRRPPPWTAGAFSGVLAFLSSTPALSSRPTCYAPLFFAHFDKCRSLPHARSGGNRREASVDARAPSLFHQYGRCRIRVRPVSRSNVQQGHITYTGIGHSISHCLSFPHPFVLFLSFAPRTTPSAPLGTPSKCSSCARAVMGESD
ncbi:hypothetical protein BV20DRAFT_45484 [Pilatotrama ljubarskyi]|nr:hypothetical protein BV20DRAFT_45484 [Pilatotrama ljubarskyi]